MWLGLCAASCSFAAPTNRTANLVINGDFQDGLNGWTKLEKPEAEIVADKELGMAVKLTGRSQPWACVQQDVTKRLLACGPGMYELSVRARAGKAEESLMIVLILLDGGIKSYVTTELVRLAPGEAKTVSSRRPVAWLGALQNAMLIIKTKQTADVSVSGFSVRQVSAATQLSFPRPDPALRNPVPLIGAIRWDGYTGTNAPVGKGVVKALSPEKYQYRLPWYSKLAGGKVQDVDGTSQETMDREILYARNAGIDYWTFCHYREIHKPWMDKLKNDYALAFARQRFLASKYRRFINWCDIFPPEYLKEPDELALFFKHMSEPNYQKVLGGRPLVYFFGLQNDTPVREFRRKAQAAGLPDPYVVGMNGNAAIGPICVAEAGADAVSAYGFARLTGGVSFPAFAANVKHSWSEFLATGVQMIPWLPTSWDNRPWHDNPSSFYSDPGAEQYIKQGTPREIAAFLKEGLAWNEQQKAATTVNSVLIYAWNENTEGGWIGPTLFELRDTGRPARLDAIRDMLAETQYAWTDLTVDPATLRSLQALAVAKVFPDLTNQRFEPQAPVTRAQFATYLSRAAALPAAEHKGCTDLPQDERYALEIATLVGLGLAPLDNGRFYPEKLITRAQALSLTQAVAKFLGLNNPKDVGASSQALTRLDAALLVEQVFKP